MTTELILPSFNTIYWFGSMKSEKYVHGDLIFFVMNDFIFD